MWKCSVKKVFLKFRKIHGETTVPEFILLKTPPHLSVFNPNAEKYGPEKTPYWDTFHTVNHCNPV